ncbi:hypothetical protein BDV97DRAFT_358411 [Delphinella strobiligena]|nr:hypothetical protein BDV97DRAFT_358411 [Delphinella strobiligena]
MPPLNRALTRATEAEIEALDKFSPTQPTQGTFDQRRMGSNPSGNEDDDAADILCILHPCSPAAFEIVRSTAEKSPQHVLQDVYAHYNDGLSQAELEEEETFILNGEVRPPQALDLALRFSSRRLNPALGFVFGRSPTICDIAIGTDTIKRVSNVHFRIYVNQSGVCMLEDLSTNGTLVDKVLLRGKHDPRLGTRMLNAGSIIEILSPKEDELIKFILRIPSRDTHMEEFNARFVSYMQEVARAEREQGGPRAQKGGTKAAYPRLAATGDLPMVRPPLVQTSWGMHWNGGERYNVVGLLGKGAFATVYRLATKDNGLLYAAKELEKRRYMKNGVLDRKLNNELQIMRTIDHPHVVRYVDYQDIAKHLYIIMEYVPCGDLQQWLKANNELPEELANVVAQQVLDALAYLHKKQVVHRDIKPDNILIANDSHHGFSVKLTDFGLSKVVKDNDTFLKTFCGTLLYCAPEVFPHYDNYLAAHGKGLNKRKTRKASTPQRPNYHSYSQSVDIWSLGGVLWYAMCLKPPFEGVADATGKGMFDKIMTTPVKPDQLRYEGVSEVAIDLLQRMLDVDPARRPTPERCLLHPWFENRTQRGDSQDLEEELGLGTIHEEEDGIEEEGAPDLSQLSLQNGGKSRGPAVEVPSFSSSDLEYLDPRQSKRFKVDPRMKLLPATQPVTRPDGSPTERVIRAQSQPQRALFGEMQPDMSLLKSSGVFGTRGYDFMPIFDAPSAESSAYATSETARDQLFTSDASNSYQGELNDDTRQEERLQNVFAHVSSNLGGVEPDMRDLNMDSPADFADSPSGDVDEPQTPRTPENAPQASLGQDGTADETPKPAQATPKERPYSRQISLPVTASFFYNPNDPSTHNPEYASSITGYDFTSNNVMPAESFHSLPPTLYGSPTSSVVSEIAAPPQPMEVSEFARPAPHLGRLTSTAASFADISLSLSTRVTSWGRATGNTLVHPDPKDVRIPKIAFVLYFHANGIEKAEQRGEEWTKISGLHCLMSTESSSGIRVNGVKLMARNKDGRRLYGRVYKGDIVTICGGPQKLEFECDFYHGEGKERRPEGAAKFHINKEEDLEQ